MIHWSLIQNFWSWLVLNWMSADDWPICAKTGPWYSVTSLWLTCNVVLCRVTSPIYRTRSYKQGFRQLEVMLNFLASPVMAQAFPWCSIVLLCITLCLLFVFFYFFFSSSLFTSSTAEVLIQLLISRLLLVTPYTIGLSFTRVYLTFSLSITYHHKLDDNSHYSTRTTVTTATSTTNYNHHKPHGNNNNNWNQGDKGWV